MSYNSQSATARLPFLAPVTATVHVLTLDRRGERDIHESALYYLQGSRNGNIERLLSGDFGGLKEPERSQFGRLSSAAQERVRQAMKEKAQAQVEGYFSREEQFSGDLAEFVTAQKLEPFDLIVTAPTGHPELLKSYFGAFAKAYPQAVHCYDCIKKRIPWKSNSGLTLEQRIETLFFDPQLSISQAERVLIVDDVVARGETAAAVTEFLARLFNHPPEALALACALWVDPTC